MNIDLSRLGWSNDVSRLLHHDMGLEFRYMALLGYVTTGSLVLSLLAGLEWPVVHYQIGSQLFFILVDNSKINNINNSDSMHFLQCFPNSECISSCKEFQSVALDESKFEDFHLNLILLLLETFQQCDKYFISKVSIDRLNFILFTNCFKKRWGCSICEVFI